MENAKRTFSMKHYEYKDQSLHLGSIHSLNTKLRICVHLMFHLLHSNLKHISKGLWTHGEHSSFDLVLPLLWPPLFWEVFPQDFGTWLLGFVLIQPVENLQGQTLVSSKEAWCAVFPFIPKDYGFSSLHRGIVILKLAWICQVQWR